jgi:hypothetical protein
MTEQEIDLAYKSLSSKMCHLWMLIELVCLGMKSSYFGLHSFGYFFRRQYTTEKA